jgi:hypothetical protein
VKITMHSAFTRHAKFLALSDRAFRRWFVLDGYCCDHLTDGIIPKAVLAELGVTPRILKELMTPPPPYTAALVEDCGDVIVLHDFTDWNDSKEEVQSGRRRLRDRVRKHRAGRNAVTGDGGNGVTNGGRNWAGNPVGTEGNSEHRTPNTEQELKNGGATAPRPVENHGPGDASPKPRALSPEPEKPDTRLIAAVLRKEGLDLDVSPGRDEADIAEQAKRSLAEFGIPYDSRHVAAAIDSERHKQVRGFARLVTPAKAPGMAS